MIDAAHNGERTRLETIEQLNEKGCAWGQVNRANLENMTKRLDGIETKLWAVLLVVFTQLLGGAAYLLFQRP